MLWLMELSLYTKMRYIAPQSKNINRLSIEKVIKILMLKKKKNFKNPISCTYFLYGTIGSFMYFAYTIPLFRFITL